MSEHRPFLGERRDGKDLWGCLGLLGAFAVCVVFWAWIIYRFLPR